MAADCVAPARQLGDAGGVEEAGRADSARGDEEVPSETVALEHLRREQRGGTSIVERDHGCRRGRPGHQPDPRPGRGDRREMVLEVGRVELVAGGKRPSEPDRFAVLDRRNVVIDQCVGHAVAAAAFRAARFQRR